MTPRPVVSRLQKVVFRAITVGVVALSVAGGVATTTSSALAAPALPTPTPLVRTFLNTIACGSTSFCVAVGAGFDQVGSDSNAYGFIAVTTDGGAQWSEPVAPAGTGHLRVVTCPTATQCYAVGDGVGQLPGHSVITTTDAGATWTLQSAPDGEAANPIDSLQTVRCPTASECYALGYGENPWAAELLVTHDAGATWTYQPGLESLVDNPSAMSCPLTGTCYVAGDRHAATDDPYDVIPTDGVIEATTDGGVTWTTQLDYPGDLPNPSDESTHLTDITCSRVQDCFAVGSGIFGTTDSGHLWTLRTTSALVATDPPPVQTAASCPRLFACYVVSGETVTTSTDGGWSWTQHPDLSVPGSGLEAIYCPLYDICYAVGSDSVFHTTDGAATWTLETVPGLGQS